MQIEPPKSRLKLDTEFDRLSDLPSEVTEKILSVLPIKEAVRTSILSSKWRYRWATRPDLVFDEQISFPESLNNHDKLVKIVDHVLVLHIGPIYEVKFSHSALNGTADVDKWILHLSRKSIKELTLRFRNTPEYKLPSTLFSIEDLVFLELYNCLIKPPRTIMGFKSLKKLQLVCVTLTQDDFENLIVSCSVLEHLLMTNWRGLTKIKIDAPTIRILEICGVFEDLKIHNALKLERLYLEAYNNQRSQVPCGSSNLVKLFSQCANIQCVTLTNYVLEYLAAGDLPLKLPKPCMHLEALFIQIPCALDMKEISTFICLLRSAPALQRLYIALPKVRQPAMVGEVISWLDGTQNFELRKLRIVEVLYISSAKAELDVIKFLLLNAPILERVAVNVESQSCFLEVSKRLNQFRRSSAQTEVVFFDP